MELNKFVCRFYIVGSCSDRSHCPLPHVKDSRRIPDTACRFYWKGKCFYGKTCWYDHVHFMMKGKTVVMQLHREQAQHRFLVRMAQEKQRKDIKPNENSGILPTSNASNRNIHNSSHISWTAGFVPGEKDLKLSVDSEEEFSYNPFVNYEKGFPRLSEIEESKPKNSITDASKLKDSKPTFNNHFADISDVLLEQSLDLSSDSRSKCHLSGEDRPVFGIKNNNISSPPNFSFEKMLKTYDEKPAFAQEILTRKNDLKTYSKSKNEKLLAAAESTSIPSKSKVLNCCLKSSVKNYAYQQSSLNSNKSNTDICSFLRNDNSTADAKNTTAPPTTKVLEGNLLKRRTRNHALQQPRLNLDKGEMNAHGVPGSGHSVAATGEIFPTSRSPDNSLLKRNTRNCNSTLQRSSLNKRDMGDYGLQRMHNSFADEKCIPTPSAPYVFHSYANMPEASTEDYALYPRNLNMDDMSWYFLPEYTAITGENIIAPLSICLPARIHFINAPDVPIMTVQHYLN